MEPSKLLAILEWVQWITVLLVVFGGVSLLFTPVVGFIVVACMLVIAHA